MVINVHIRTHVFYTQCVSHIHDSDVINDAITHTLISMKTNFLLSLSLHPLVRPVIDEFVFPKSLHEGQRYNVLCTVIKGDAPLEIQWLKDGLPLPANSLKSTSGHLKGVTVSQVTEFSAMLNFASLLSEHRGNYTCKATNIAGSASYTVKMEIQGKLIFCVIFCVCFF